MKAFWAHLILAIFAATHAVAFRLKRGKFGGAVRAFGHGPGAHKGPRVPGVAADTVAATSGSGSDKSETEAKLKAVKMMDGTGPRSRDMSKQLSTLGESLVDASQGITEAARERNDADARMEKAATEFAETRVDHAREMSIRKNDLAVFDFILKMTACKDGAGAPAQPQVSICSTRDGPVWNFKDAQLQARFEGMMTPEARVVLREALGRASAPLGLLQEGGQEQCVDGTPNCGLLHDLMSVERAKFRDAFNELTAEMNQNQEQFDSTKRKINEEITIIDDQKTKHMEVLADTISAINADME